MTKAERVIIAAYTAELGSDKFRTSRDGSVYIYGSMPNASQWSGWWYAGHYKTVVARYMGDAA